MALVGLKQDRGRGYGNRALFFLLGRGFVFCLSSVGLVSCVGYIGFFFFRKSPSS